MTSEKVHVHLDFNDFLKAIRTGNKDDSYTVISGDSEEGLHCKVYYKGREVVNVKQLVLSGSGFEFKNCCGDRTAESLSSEVKSWKDKIETC